MTPESDSDDPPGASGRVILRTFATHEAAELTVAQLEAHGIASWITADDCGGMLPNLAMAGGVRVLVSSKDEEAAKVLLDAPNSAVEFPDENEIVPESPPPSTGHPPKKLALGQILLGVAIGALATWSFQEPANPSRVTHYHYTADGKADEEWIYRHGYLIEYRQDRNLDGAWDHWAYYGPRGLERAEYDNNFDKKPDETWTYSNGDLLTMQKDNDFNGVPDEFCTYKYRIIQQAEMRPNGSKFTTIKEIFTNGILSEIWSGGDSNGNFKAIVSYDPFFNSIHTNAAIYPLLSVP